jgi:hypothetical protein
MLLVQTLDARRGDRGGEYEDVRRALTVLLALACPTRVKYAGETRMTQRAQELQLIGADDLDVLVDEDVMRPVDADVWDSYSPLLSFTTRSTMPPG